MSNTIAFIYVPVPDQTTGRDIANNLVERKLVACANLMPAHTAIYEWEGKLDECKEHVLILKTHLERADEVMSEIEKMHPYDCPCVLKVPAEANPAFAEWVNGCTKAP